jgi:transposase
MQGRDPRIMALPLLFVGIDVSKASLDVWIESRRSSERFGNDPDGWKALIDRLAEVGAAPASSSRSKPLAATSAVCARRCFGRDCRCAA